MKGENIVVIASLSVKEGMEKKFSDAALEVAAKTRTEPGCVAYEVLQDVSDARKFHFIEEYVDQSAFDAHRKMPYMAPFRELREKLVDKYFGVRSLLEIARR